MKRVHEPIRSRWLSNQELPQWKTKIGDNGGIGSYIRGGGCSPSHAKRGALTASRMQSGGVLHLFASVYVIMTYNLDGCDSTAAYNYMYQYA